MWLLPSYKRPHLCKQAIEAAHATGMDSPAVLFVDPPTDGYENIKLPPNWQMFIPHEHMGMAAAMRWCFKTFPHEPFYGWLSDDLHPRTTDWDKKLIAAADRFFMVCCNDLQFALDPNIRDGVICGAMCWGGDLVRAVGWWALPGVYQAGIDDAWIHLAHRIFDVKIYLPNVIVEHMSYKNGKRPKDYTDEWVRNDDAYIERDFEMFKWWRGTTQPHEAGQRIKEAMRKAGYDVEGDVMEKIHGPGFRYRQTA